MIARLALWSLLATVILALMMGVTMRIGQRQATPERIARLHLADCELPCWNGITPGVSSPNEVERRIEGTFPQFKSILSSSNLFRIWRLENPTDGNELTLDFVFKDGVVASMGIGTGFESEQMPRLGELLAVFGAPTCVSIPDERANFANFFYENISHQIILTLAVPSPSLSSSVLGISIDVSSRETCQNMFASLWQDFRKSHYASLFAS